MKTYFVVYEFTGRRYWETVRSSKSPEEVAKRFRKVRVVSVEVDETIPAGKHGTVVR